MRLLTIDLALLWAVNAALFNVSRVISGKIFGKKVSRFLECS